MKFSCEKYLLQSAVATASRAAAAKSSVPALEGLLVEAGTDTVKVTGYDLKTGITTTIPADVSSGGYLVLNARLLGDIVRKLPDEILTVEVDDNYMTRIRSGMSDFEIVGTSADDYPELPSVESVSFVDIPGKILRSMISQTCFAVSDNEARPIHTGALFEIENGKLTMVAVDGYRLALRREEIEGAGDTECSFVVPGSALSEVEKIAPDSDDKVRITLGAKHVVFTTEDTTLISRRLEGEFLNYKKSIPSVEKYTISVSASDLIASVERVSLIISDRLKSPVRCTFGDGVIRLLTVTPLGRASDECSAEGSAEDLEIGFNNRYLLDALKAVPADKVLIKLMSGISPCLIVPADDGDSFLYMILPVRLKANEG